MPAEANIDAAQINMVKSAGVPQVDGKVWTREQRLCGRAPPRSLATGKIATWLPFKAARKGEAHNIYDEDLALCKNNVFFTDFRHRHIGRIPCSQSIPLEESFDHFIGAVEQR